MWGLSCNPWAELPHSMWNLTSTTRDQTCVSCTGKQILDQFDQYRQEEKNLPRPNLKKKARKKAFGAMRITGKGSYFSLTEPPFFICARCGNAISSGYYFTGGIRLCASCRNETLDKKAEKRSVWSTSGGVPGTGKKRWFSPFKFSPLSNSHEGGQGIILHNGWEEDWMEAIIRQTLHYIVRSLSNSLSARLFFLSSSIFFL